jgi:hypothetical protein
MKIINKSGNKECSSEDSFYVLLSPEVGDFWIGDDFRCNTAEKYGTEEEAIEAADSDMVIAKVTLVAKIV